MRSHEVTCLRFAPLRYWLFLFLTCDEDWDITDSRESPWQPQHEKQRAGYSQRRPRVVVIVTPEGWRGGGHALASWRRAWRCQNPPFINNNQRTMQHSWKKTCIMKCSPWNKGGLHEVRNTWEQGFISMQCLTYQKVHTHTHTQLLCRRSTLGFTVIVTFRIISLSEYDYSLFLFSK